MDIKYLLVYDVKGDHFYGRPFILREFKFHWRWTPDAPPGEITSHIIIW